MPKTCQFCVMNESDPEIVFYEDGCNHCRDYFKNGLKYIIKNERILELLIKKLKDKEKGKQFDCVQGISGGTDSSYTAFLAHKLGLNVHLTHLDNGYDDPKADANIKRIVKYTDFSIEHPKIDFNTFKDLQLSYLKAGVIDLEVPTDHAISAVVYKTADRYGLPFLSGSNITTEAIQPKAWGHRKNDLPNLKNIHRRFGKQPLKGFPTMGLWKTQWYQKIKGIQQINLLNYVDYNRERAKSEMAEAFGWQDYGLKHWESIYTRFYQAHILPLRWGVDKRRSHFSNLICSGQMTRYEALKELESPPYPNELFEKDKTTVLSKLGISQQEFDRYMNQPKRSHYAFSSDEYLYRLLKGIRRLF